MVKSPAMAPISPTTRTAACAFSTALWAAVVAHDRRSADGDRRMTRSWNGSLVLAGFDRRFL